MPPPHICLLSPSSSPPCLPLFGWFLRPIIPLAAGQGHGGIVFNFSALQMIVHPHPLFGPPLFTSSLNCPLCNQRLPFDCVASQCHIFGFHPVAHKERMILRRISWPVALKSVQSLATMSPLVGAVNLVICLTAFYATSCVVHASGDRHPTKGVFALLLVLVVNLALVACYVRLPWR